MTFYINTVMEAKLPGIRRAVAAGNPTVDPEYVGKLVEAEIKKHVPEMAYKFNLVAIILIDYVMSGQISRIRDFEAKFEDLLDRTLLKGMDVNQLLSHFIGQLIQAMSGGGIDPDDFPKTKGSA